MQKNTQQHLEKWIKTGPNFPSIFKPIVFARNYLPPTLRHEMNGIHIIMFFLGGRGSPTPTTVPPPDGLNCAILVT